MIDASSSSNDSHDYNLLGADQEQAPKTQTSTHDASSSSVIPPHREEVSLHSGIHLTRNTRISGRMTFQCKFVFYSQREINYFFFKFSHCFIVFQFGDEINDKNLIVSKESGFQTP